jgi:hypothetical protein
MPKKRCIVPFGGRACETTSQGLTRNYQYLIGLLSQGLRCPRCHIKRPVFRLMQIAQAESVHD